MLDPCRAEFVLDRYVRLLEETAHDRLVRQVLAARPRAQTSWRNPPVAGLLARFAHVTGRLVLCLARVAGAFRPEYLIRNGVEHEVVLAGGIGGWRNRHVDALIAPADRPPSSPAGARKRSQLRAWPVGPGLHEGTPP